MRFRSLCFGAAFVLTLAAAGTLFWLAASVASPSIPTESGTANVAVVRQFYAAVNHVLRTGETGDLEHVAATDLVEHAVPRGLPPTRDGLVADLTALRATWPKLQLQLDQVMAQDDLVSARVRVLGTGAGTFLGLPLPVPVTVWGTGELFRVAGGQIIEEWGDPERLALFEPWQQTQLNLGLSSGRGMLLQRVTYDLAARGGGMARLGPQLLYLEAGALLMTIERSPGIPATIIRATPDGAAPAPAVLHLGVETRLEAGDLVSLPDAVSYTLRNPDVTPTTFLALAIQTEYADEGREGEVRPAWPIVVAPGIAVQNLAGDSVSFAVGPLGQSAIALGHVTLPSGAEFSPHKVQGAELYTVDTGSARLTLASGSAVVRRAGGVVQSLTADNGPSADLSAGDGVLVEAGAASRLANTGGEPATLLVVTLRPGSYDLLPRQNPR